MAGRWIGLCQWCGEPLQYAGTGRLPKYCKRSHRELAYQLRRDLDLAERLGLAERKPAKVERAPLMRKKLARPPGEEPGEQGALF